MSSRPSSSGLVAIAIALFTATAGAGPSGDRAVAESLFQDAKKLMTQGNFGEACPKLEESQRLDPSGGTLLNLAVCHEKQGKTATAWAEFRDALAQASVDRRPERERLARERIAAIEPKLPRITIELAPDAEVQGFLVQRDGEPVSRSLYRTAFPVDPGTHSFAAAAPGKKSWSSSIDIAENESKKVIVPALTDVPVAPPAASSAAPPPPPPPDQSGRKTAAYVVGGVGVVGVAIGTIFGLSTFSKQSKSNQHCPLNQCDADGVSSSEQAHKAAMLSDVGFAVGIIGVGIGTYLLVTTPSAPPPDATTSSLRVDPAIGRNGATLRLGGTF